MANIDPERLGYIQERVNVFLEKLRESPLYNVADLDMIGETARAALDTTVTKYARGACELPEVEAAARDFAQACKKVVPETKPARRKGNEPPPTYREQKKQTYHWAQGRQTPRDQAARARMDARDAENARVCEEIFNAGVLDHRANFPNCTGLHCPYCKAMDKPD